MAIIQPFGLITFYDAKVKRIHQRDGIDVNPERIPILWDNADRLPMCQFFTEIFSGAGAQSITVLKVLCNDESTEVDLIADVADFVKISCEAENITFWSWVYYATSNLSVTLDVGIWSIEVTVNDGTNNQTFYSNKFIIE